MKFKILIILIVILLTVAACSTKSSNDIAKESIVSSVITPTNWTVEVNKINKSQKDWLKTFNDPVLVKLIEDGYANNAELQVAAGNMDKAWLLAKKSGASLKPTADLTLGPTQSGRGEGSTPDPTISIGLQVSWELDVWGRLKAGANAAKARAQAARADFIFAQHSLNANIAKTYFKVIEAKLQTEIVKKNLDIIIKTVQITQVKYDNGRASGQDIALARANLASVNEQLVKIEGSQRDAVRALEVLLGRYPNVKTEIPARLPDLPPSPPAGVPSEILERRPDIVSAERQIAAAFNATGQAKAARLPRFALTSSVTGASDSLSEVLNPANVAWQVAANLMAPLFDGGKRKIDVEIATIEQKQAVQTYIQKALTAFSEVENNLDQAGILADRNSALSEALRQSEKAYRIAELRYNEGESDLLDTLQIQQQAISAESNLLSIKRSQLEQRINLYLSLGGSW